MKIGGYEVPIRFNSKAMIDIETLIGGDVEKLTDYLGEKDVTTGETLKRVANILTCLANGEIFTHNQDIKCGFKQGEEKKFFTADFFLAHIDIEHMQDIISSMYKEINNGTAVIVPDGVKLAEEDEVLAEIEEIKNQ